MERLSRKAQMMALGWGVEDAPRLDARFVQRLRDVEAIILELRSLRTATPEIERLMAWIKDEDARHQLPLSEGGSRANLSLHDGLLLVGEIERLREALTERYRALLCQPFTV